MAKVKNKFTRLGRALSTSHHSASSTGFKKRSRSISEILDSEQSSLSGAVDGDQVLLAGAHEDSLMLTYHGYTVVDEPRSSKDVLLALRSIRTNYYTTKSVTLTYDNGTLRVTDCTGEGILVTPLHAVGLVVHDVSKDGYNDCLAISFGTGHYAKQCHVFQARSNREAADSHLVLQKCVRNSNKDRKFRKTESGTSISSGVVEGSKGRRPMQLMEDEDEFVEHKSLAYNGGRRDSKRSIPAILHSSSDIAASLSGSTPQPPTSLVHSDSSSSSLHQLPGGHKDKKKLGQRKSGPSRVTSGDHGEFRRQDKVEQLEAAINKIKDNNTYLVEQAKQLDTPTNVFEVSLVAMVQGNLPLLNHYMSLGQVANYHDGSGNTLLHYAVALDNINCVSILCNNHADLEASGWNNCKPIHRAVAEGHTHILQSLLQNKANVNSLDLMRRTPLHFASAKMELMECTISLLECGAQVMLSDILGLRPVDLNPDLKETLNRLVTSACETFVSAPINQMDQNGPPERTATPTSFSPGSSPSSSSMLDTRGSGSWDMDHRGDDLAQIVEKVNRQARVLASQTHRRKSGSKGHAHSRSYGNLVDLHNEEKVEDKLKYPSDCAVDSTYYQMLQDKDHTLKALQRLVQFSNDDTTPRNSHEITVAHLPADLETSLSEPDLHKTADDGEPRSNSSAAVLQDQRLKFIIGGKMTKFRADSGSSTGTLREEDTDSDSMHLLSKAFDDLQDDLKAKRQSDDELGSGDKVTMRKLRPHPPSADSSPLTMRRSKEETLAIFDGILAQFDADTASMASASEITGSRGPEPNQVPHSESASASPQLTVIKRRVQSSDVLSSKAAEVPRPSSSASFNKGVESSEDILPRASSVEADLVFGTLPKKKKKKWSGIKKITNSPLFGIRSRRKSFTHGSNHTPSSIARTSVSTYVPSVPTTAEVVEKDNSRTIRSMTPQLANSKQNGQVERRVESQGEEGVTVKEVLVSPVMINDRVEKVAMDKLRKLSMPTPSRRGRGKDECLKALKVMTTLSSNKESLSTLVSYICLPKCINKLIEISQSNQTSSSVLTIICTLLSNLYQSASPDNKKTAVGSGVIDLTIKLLQARDPLPTTCLTLLNGLLTGEDESDSLRAIIRIPTAPLLQYLESCDQSCDARGSDSGIGSGSRRDTISSLDTRYSSDVASSTADEGMGGANLLALPTKGDSTRSSSFVSEASEGNGGGRTVLSPTLALRAGHPGTPTTPDLSPRRIVLKVLAVSSAHSKMQSSLTTEKALTLLAGCVDDSSQENVVNALISLANVAQNVRSHEMMMELGIVDIIQPLLAQGPRQRYHATRILVYLGQLHLLKGCGLFNDLATEYEADVCTSVLDVDGHSYARGATIEKCIQLLTSDFTQLWGGFSYTVGPQLQEGESFLPLQASKDQVLQFFLTTYKTFAHPIIVMRLLLHRLSLDDSLNLFDWSVDCGPHPISSTAHLVSVPPTQSNILLLLVRWLELFPDDFLECSQLKEEVEKVIARLKMAMGPYIPHTHRLRSLLQDVDRPRTEQGDSVMKTEERAPHHDNLYRLCQQMVTGGHLPVNLHEAIFMASLQLHIEQICKGSTGAVNVNLRSRRGTVMFRSVFPPGVSKSKGLLKRVEAQMQEFEKLSMRNAKHMYIERCQANPGYDCSFFTVKVPSSGGRFKRGPVAKQLMGINSRRIVFLDEKTKDLIASHSLQSVSSISREADPCVLIINLLGDSSGFKVQVDSAADAKAVTNVLEERREGEALLEDQAMRWSESVPSLFTMSMEPEVITADTDSISTTNTPSDREGTPSGHMLSHDNLLNCSPDVGVVGAVATPPNGHVDNKVNHKSDTLRVLSQDDLLTSDLHDHVTTIDKTKLLQFCDCPPDPEIPPGIDLKAVSLEDILTCPLEVARQMTLIDHKRFGELTSVELLQKVHLIPKPASSAQRDSIASTATLRSSLAEGGETAVEKLAFRFNQVGNWVVHSILQFEFVEERVQVLQQFIAIAKHCLKLGNFSSMMAIVVAGLGSAPVRRLQQTWGQLPKTDMEAFREMDTILDSRGNYKHYRDKLSATAVPAVPYVGVFLKDLTFLCDGNPDYLRGGLINLHKRRQVYRLLEEIHYYQKDSYKLHAVPELQMYLLSHKLKAEDDLHSMSHTLEPRGIRRSHSSSSTKSLSSVHGRSFFRGLTRTSSSGAAYQHRTSAASST